MTEGPAPLKSLFEEWPEVREVSKQLARMTRLPALQAALRGSEEALTHYWEGGYQGPEGSVYAYTVYFDRIQRLISQGPVPLEVELPCALGVRFVGSVRLRTELHRFRVRAKGQPWREVTGMFLWDTGASRLELYLFKEYDTKDPSPPPPDGPPGDADPGLAPDGLPLFEPYQAVERILEWREPTARGKCSPQTPRQPYVAGSGSLPREGPCMTRGVDVPEKASPRLRGR